jgi:phosphinothricin acetyltransferase
VAALTARPAVVADVPAITEIYNEGIADRIATFETEPRTTDQVAAWLDRCSPILVVEDADGVLVAWASTWRDVVIVECLIGEAA